MRPGWYWAAITVAAYILLSSCIGAFAGLSWKYGMHAEALFILMVIPCYWWILVLHEWLHWLAVQLVNKKRAPHEKLKTRFVLTDSYNPAVRITGEGIIEAKEAVFILLLPFLIVPFIAGNLIGNVGALIAVLISASDVATAFIYAGREVRIRTWFQKMLPTLDVGREGAAQVSVSAAP